MGFSCNKNGTNCTKHSTTAKTRRTETVVGIALGSVACLLFIVLIVILMYKLCSKQYFRSRPFRFRSSPVAQNQEQTPSKQAVSPKLGKELPPVYQDGFTTDPKTIVKNIDG